MAKTLKSGGRFLHSRGAAVWALTAAYLSLVAAFQPADWHSDSTMFSVHSKSNGQNQTADTQIRTSSER